MISALELAYTAGIVDGEGNITITRHLAWRGLRPGYAVMVTVTNTNTDLLEWLKRRFGGNIYARKPVKSHHKVVHSWQLGGNNQARGFLELVYPFLLVKKLQAEIALAFLASYTPSRGGKTSDEEAALREGFCLAIRAANQGNGRGGPRRRNWEYTGKSLSKIKLALPEELRAVPVLT